MDTLPTELVDNILEDVYFTDGVVDTTTLSSCALSCRAWSGPAQKLLFRHVTLRGMYQSRGHLSFLEATDPKTKRGRALAGHVRVLEVFLGDKAGLDLDDADLADILDRTPRLYELVLRVTGIHQFTDGTMEKLRKLATGPLRLRALTILSCGIQSPILFQLLSVWPSIEFLHIGVEIAPPAPRWRPTFKLYQLTLMRTPRIHMLKWLLSSSMDSLRILSFRDLPGRDFDPLLEQLGPGLRSLRLMNYSLRAASVTKQCPNLEEFVIVQLSPFLKLSNLPQSLEHLSCRNLPTEDQSLQSIIEAVSDLPKLKVVTCDRRAREDELFGELEGLCASKGVELFVDETPFWVREDPVPVERFPRNKSVANFALMN
ncbi:hypothetical protein L227DRAFT_544864 [Lentinus tigrinus ALCF2SS1-6]|uniref:F-box domain-containing protein n=1 Tax=Lentinus tigrinus ALCF2SS1-6 TaxID=1328759 RepID=A0A5C2SGD0_9APHY|nr:hypothetical protein L227DRAFT_544864 [Lentinus tigrinus ALCF2SS1-6]